MGLDGKTWKLNARRQPSALLTFPQAMFRHHAQLRGMQLDAKRAGDALGKGVVQDSMLVRLVRGQVSGARKRFHM